MELRDKVVLVTGANGFVGSFVCQRLRAEGLRVRALVRRPHAELERLGVETHVGELIDPKVQEAAVRGTHAVVHCAATSERALDEARRVNAQATAELAQAALAAGCERFVHISTIAVYEIGAQEVIDEDTPQVTQGDAYGVTKAEAEQALHEASARGLPIVILRPGIILGVHPTSTWGTLIPALVAQGQFPQVDGGKTQLGYLHISSLTEAVVLALRQDAAVGQAFTIVDGHTAWHRYTDFFRTGPLPSLPPEQAPGFLAFRGRFANERAQRVLGFVPRDVFDSSMAEIVAARPKS